MMLIRTALHRKVGFFCIALQVLKLCNMKAYQRDRLSDLQRRLF